MSRLDFNEKHLIQRQSTFDSLLAGSDKYLSTDAIAETRSILKKNKYRKYISSESGYDKSNIVTESFTTTTSAENAEASTAFEQEKENAIKIYMNRQPNHDDLTCTSSDSLFDGIDVEPVVKKKHFKSSPRVSDRKLSLEIDDLISKSKYNDSTTSEEYSSSNTSILNTNDSTTSYSLQDTVSSQDTVSKTKKGKAIRFGSEYAKASKLENTKRAAIFTFSNISEVCDETRSSRNDLNYLPKHKQVKELKSCLRNKNHNVNKRITKKKNVCFEDTKMKKKYSLCGGLSNLKFTAKGSVCDVLNKMIGPILNVMVPPQKAFACEVGDITESNDDESTVIDMGDYKETESDNDTDTYQSDYDESISYRSRDNETASYESGESALSVGTGIIYTINISPRRQN